MASIRPSAFNQRERLDGGPFLVIEAAEPEEEGINVFFTDIPAAERKPDSPIASLLNVCPDRLTIWPLNIREDRDDYLQPKYGTLERIVGARPVIAGQRNDEGGGLQQWREEYTKDLRFRLGQR